MRSIVAVSGDEGVVRQIRSSLPPGARVVHALDTEAAQDLLRRRRHDLLIADVGQLRNTAVEGDFRSALRPFREIHATLPIVVMSSKESIREAVKAVKAGAADYITYPIDDEELKLVLETVYGSIIARAELEYLRDAFWRQESTEIVQTKHPLMRAVFDKVRAVSPTRSTVLLMGETGTGKGVLARLIHDHSNRRDAQFISVHCGAIPDTLLESELFGHEKGAFTGAVRRKLGKFEIAGGGTIFLDEVSTLTPSAQIKLLQVLQEGVFQRVGGEATIEVDVRVISATNTDLKKMCEEGKFRSDLYYRLNVFPIEIPPLRQRREDITHFVTAFLKKMNRLNAKEIHDVDPRVIEALKEYDWPGNIRELENLVERAYILEASSTLGPESFPSDLFDSETERNVVSIDSSLSLSEVRRKAVEDVEKNYLKELLAEKKGKINESASAAGITTRQLHKLMAKYGLRKEIFKT